MQCHATPGSFSRSSSSSRSPFPPPRRPRPTAPPRAAIRQATIDLHQAVLAQAPAIRAAQRQFSDDPACATALKGAPDDQSVDLVFEFVLPALFEIEIGPIKAPLAAFSARLEQIPMRNTKLKSGRAAWRIYAAKFGQFAPAPTDICARLDAWRQAGYPAASRPAIRGCRLRRGAGQ